jgi:dihydrofolate reductase
LNLYKKRLFVVVLYKSPNEPDNPNKGRTNMRKILVSESLTLDGVFEAPAKVAGETFEYAGWSEPYSNEELMKHVSESMAGGDALLLGRVTYQLFEASWSPQTGPVADYMNNVTKYVVSTTLKKAEWNNSTLIKGDIAEEITKLKKQSGKDIAVLGSGALVHSLMEYDLIDKYLLLVYPVVLGTGKRFLGDGNKTPLKLKETKPFGSGVVFLSYEPDRKASG